MKKNAILLFCLFLFTSTYAQKVKYKKGKILVDKVEKYEFVKTRDGKLLKNILPHFTLKNVEGKELLVFTDKMVYFESLPNETDKRLSYGTFVCTNPQTNKSTVIGFPKALNMRKHYTNQLKDLGFFKSGKMTDEIYDAFIAAQDQEQVKNWEIHTDSTNINRLKNYELTKNQFGDLMKRKPGIISISIAKEIKIKDGPKEVGSIVPRERGSYAHIFEVVNNEGITIGTIALFVNQNRGNVKTFVNDKFKFINFKRNRDGTEPSQEDKFELLAEYLILQGFL